MMLKNPWVKNILSAVAVVIGGMILLNLTFMFDFGFQSLLKFIFYRNTDLMMTVAWLPGFQHGLFVVLIGFISWLIFRTKWPTLIKAIYLPVPTAVVLVTVGILTYQWSIASYGISTILVLGTLYWFYRTKQPWLYYFSVIWVAIALLIMGITGVEI